jgi:hypothetical protein
MDENYYLDFIEAIDLEKDFEIYETLTSIELGIVLRSFYSHRKLHDEGIKNNSDYIYHTCEQKKQRKKLCKWLLENYPNDINNEKRKEKNKKIRDSQCTKFDILCKKNNRLYYTDDVLKRIKGILEPRKTFTDNDRSEYIKKYGRTQIVCECGCLTYQSNLARHKNSNLHKKNLLLVKDIH